MLLLKLTFAFTLMGTLLADPQQDIQECVNTVGLQELDDHLPDSDDLEDLCPKIMQLFNCVDDVPVKYVGVNATNLAEISSPDSIPGKASRIFVNMRSLFTDICTEGTSLNSALKVHSDCMATVRIDRECTEEAIRAYGAYKRLEDVAQNEAGDDESDDNEICITGAYLSACLAAKVHEECGFVAFSTFVEIVKRSSVFKYAICSAESLEELQTTFTDNLEMESPRKDLFRMAFNLRRRRK